MREICGRQVEKQGHPIKAEMSIGNVIEKKAGKRRSQKIELCVRKKEL